MSMVVPRTNATYGFGVETTYGTKPSTTDKIFGTGISQIAPTARRPPIVHNDVHALNPTKITSQAQKPQLSLGWTLSNPDIIGVIFGGGNAGTVSTIQTKYISAPPTSFSIVSGYTDGSNNTRLQLLGTLATDFGVRVRQDEAVECSGSFVSAEAIKDTTAFTNSEAYADPFDFADFELSLGGTALKTVVEFDLSVRTGYGIDYYTGNTKGGAPTLQTPEYSGSFVIQHNEYDSIAKLLTGDNIAGTAVFDNGTKKIVFDLVDLKITESAPTTSRETIVHDHVSFTCRAVGGGSN